VTAGLDAKCAAVAHLPRCLSRPKSYRDGAEHADSFAEDRSDYISSPPDIRLGILPDCRGHAVDQRSGIFNKRTAEDDDLGIQM
jgi:hypothetical protein